MAENKKYGRVWIPSEEFWDLAIPMPEDVTEIKDPQHLYWHLEGWLEEMLLQSSEAEEEAHNLVSELQKLSTVVRRSCHLPAGQFPAPA